MSESRRNKILEWLRLRWIPLAVILVMIPVIGLLEMHHPRHLNQPSAQAEHSTPEHDGKANPAVTVSGNGTSYVLSYHPTNEYPESGPWGVPWDGYVAILTLVLSFVTALLVVVTRQAVSDARKSSQDALKIATDAAKAAVLSTESYKAVERAWVSVLQYQPANEDGHLDDKPFTGTSFQTIWRNNGRTPAIKCIAYSDHLILKSGEKEDSVVFSKPSNVGQRAAPIGPGSGFGSVPRPIPINAIDDLKGRKCRLFLWSCVEYEDIFDGKARHTEACVEVSYRGEASINEGPMIALWNYTPWGNQNSAN